MGERTIEFDTSDVDRHVGKPVGEMVVLYAVAHDGVNVDEDDARGFPRGKLASYKIPRRVLFFDESELSLTGNAKVRTDELRELAVARLDTPADTR